LNRNRNGLGGSAIVVLENGSECEAVADGERRGSWLDDCEGCSLLFSFVQFICVFSL